MRYSDFIIWVHISFFTFTVLLVLISKRGLGAFYPFLDHILIAMNFKYLYSVCKFYIKNMHLMQALVNVLQSTYTYLQKHSLGFYFMVQYDTDYGLVSNYH